MEIRADKWRAASSDIIDFLEGSCRSASGSPHWPSVLAASSILTGEAALMAAERVLPSSGQVFSRRAERWFHSETQSPATLSGYLRRVLIDGFRIDPEEAPDVMQALRRVGASFGTRPFPPLPPEAAHAPLFWPLNAGPRWRRAVHERAAAYGLSRAEAVYALLGSVIEAMRRGRDDLPPPVAASIAMESMLAAMRTAPLLDENHAENASYAPAASLVANPVVFVGEALAEPEADPSETVEIPFAMAPPRRVFGRRRPEQEAARPQAAEG